MPVDAEFIRSNGYHDRNDAVGFGVLNYGHLGKQHALDCCMQASDKPMKHVRGCI